MHDDCMCWMLGGADGWVDEPRIQLLASDLDASCGVCRLERVREILAMKAHSRFLYWSSWRSRPW